MNAFCVYAAGCWGMLSVIAFSEDEKGAAAFKAFISLTLLCLASLDL